MLGEEDTLFKLEEFMTKRCYSMEDIQEQLWRLREDPAERQKEVYWAPFALEDAREAGTSQETRIQMALVLEAHSRKQEEKCRAPRSRRSWR